MFVHREQRRGSDEAWTLVYHRTND